jgi:hypothetical protein
MPQGGPEGVFSGRAQPPHTLKTRKAFLSLRGLYGKTKEKAARNVEVLALRILADRGENLPEELEAANFHGRARRPCIGRIAQFISLGTRRRLERTTSPNLSGSWQHSPG